MWIPPFGIFNLQRGFQILLWAFPPLVNIEFTPYLTLFISVAIVSNCDFLSSPRNSLFQVFSLVSNGGSSLWAFVLFQYNDKLPLPPSRKYRPHSCSQRSVQRILGKDLLTAASCMYSIWQWLLFNAAVDSANIILRNETAAEAKSPAAFSRFWEQGLTLSVSE